ncbi:uncharacterized protein LOC142224773 [Haematobia irritans]|uniref:uncharacterized protein LOC142224773 n=1 Tax=Haematobia irritans TaxID=7368 RepID=UPI003F50A47B
MATINETVADLLKKQQETIEKQQQLMERLVALQNNTANDEFLAIPKSNTSGSEVLMDILAKNIREFVYDPGDNQIFELWFERYEDIFVVEGKQLDEAAKVRLLLRKVSAAVFDKYRDYLLPKHTRDISFATTIEILKKLFGKKESQFSLRVKCMQCMLIAIIQIISVGNVVKWVTRRGPSWEKKNKKRRTNINGVYSTNVNSNNRRFVSMLVNGIDIKLQHDTGSDLTLISKATWVKIGKPVLRPSRRKPTDASANQIKIMGELSADVKLNNKNKTCTIAVSPISTLNLLGSDLLETFQMWDISINSYTSCNKISSTISETTIRQMFPTVFRNEIGHCKTVKIEVDESTKKLLVINTHRGLYTFNRLAQGVKSAPGAFQEAIESILAGIVGAFPYLDDVIVATQTRAENVKVVEQGPYSIISFMAGIDSDNENNVYTEL